MESEFPVARDAVRVAEVAGGGNQDPEEIPMSGGSGGAFRPRMQLLLSDDQVNGYLRGRLRDYNDRDTEAIQRHLRGLRDALRQTGNEVIELDLEGRSYGTPMWMGLSDVDVLLNRERHVAVGA